MVRSAGCVRLLVRVCRINRRRRPRRWMSSSTRCPTILPIWVGIVATHHIDKSTGG